MFCGAVLSLMMTFSSPVNHDVSLAGNFGEPRLNHFHGGVDIKTGGVEGKAVLSVGDGYVSRIVVGLYGYGKAVFVRHPEGYTSMYCHLKKFCPKVESLARKWQYSLQTCQIDVMLKPTDCPVSRGQLIAASGNTGASRAPHLHMEMCENASGMMVDPLDFIGEYVKDTVGPVANGFMAYPQAGEGVFCGISSKQSHVLSSSGGVRRYTAWGKVGFGLWASDYMDNSYNSFGIRETSLAVDGRNVFHCEVGEFMPSDNPMMNFCGDYDFYLKHGVWYMKSFMEPGIVLPMVETDSNRGIINFNEERDYDLVYSLTDYAGNSKDYKFIVTGRKSELVNNGGYSNMFRQMEWNKINVLSMPGAELLVKPRSLANNIELRPVVRRRQGGLSGRYSFYDTSYPLLKRARLRLKCDTGVADTNKLYITSSYGTKYCRSEYKDGWLTGYIRDLGALYEVAYDDQPPVVVPIGQDKWMIDETIRLGITDSGSGIKYFRGYVDGDFVLFEGVHNSSLVLCNLKNTPVRRKNRKRILKVVVADYTDNKYTFTAQIKY